VNFFIRINEQQGGNANRFFAVLYLTAAICGVLVSLCSSAAKKTPSPLRSVLSPRLLPWLLLLGVCNGVCFYMTERIAGYLNAAAQFTITTAASILLSLSVGILCGQEKLSGKIAVSFLLCLAAVGCQALALVG
jgi:drug/metabolite transporter (DMT)-like permease